MEILFRRVYQNESVIEKSMFVHTILQHRANDFTHIGSEDNNPYDYAPVLHHLQENFDYRNDWRKGVRASIGVM